jgi:Timeless protein
LINLLDDELVLDIIVYLSADITVPNENSQYNLLLMELLHYLFKDQDPATVAKVSTIAPSGLEQE